MLGLAAPFAILIPLFSEALMLQLLLMLQEVLLILLLAVDITWLLLIRALLRVHIVWLRLNTISSVTFTMCIYMLPLTPASVEFPAFGAVPGSFTALALTTEPASTAAPSSAPVATTSPCHLWFWASRPKPGHDHQTHLVALEFLCLDYDMIHLCNIKCLLYSGALATKTHLRWKTSHYSNS